MVKYMNKILTPLHKFDFDLIKPPKTKSMAMITALALRQIKSHFQKQPIFKFELRNKKVELSKHHLCRESDQFLKLKVSRLCVYFYV